LLRRFGVHLCSFYFYKSAASWQQLELLSRLLLLLLLLLLLMLLMLGVLCRWSRGAGRCATTTMTMTMRRVGFGAGTLTRRKALAAEKCVGTESTCVAINCLKGLSPVLHRPLDLASVSASWRLIPRAHPAATPICTIQATSTKRSLADVLLKKKVNLICRCPSRKFQYHRLGYGGMLV